MKSSLSFDMMVGIVVVAVPAPALTIWSLNAIVGTHIDVTLANYGAMAWLMTMAAIFCRRKGTQ